MKLKKQYLRLYIPVYLIAFLFYILTGFIEPLVFTWKNNINLFTRITPLIFAGMAQSYVLITGGIDLSIGSIISLTHVLAINMPFTDKPFYIFIWIFIPALVGLFLGLVNGFIISESDLPPLIVTLSTGAIFKGIALYIMPRPGGSLSLTVAKLATGTFCKIPNSLIIFIFFTSIFNLILNKTEYGRSVYAVGANENIAYESGILCGKIKILTYGISGLLASFAGMFLAAWIRSGDPLIGDPYIINSIAVAVLSGTSLSGGKGGVAGVIGGAFIYLLINNSLNLLEISTFYQFVVKGIILIVAITISSTSKNFNIKDTFLKIF